LVLDAQLLDDLLLLPVDEAGQDGEEEAPGLEDESMLIAILKVKWRASPRGIEVSIDRIKHQPSVCRRRDTAESGVG
jgi:hypothetical protein